jgi:chemotaxis protein histidine kinase CheA
MTAQLYNPPNRLQQKVGGRLAGFDADAIARAEQALAAMSSQFADWIADEVTKLDTARNDAKAAGFTISALESLYARAHDMKGLGTTYGYPIVTRIAGSLCKLIDNTENRQIATKQGSLLEAHVDAIKAAVRQGIKAEDHPVGIALATELENRVIAGA